MRVACNGCVQRNKAFALVHHMNRAVSVFTVSSTESLVVPATRRYEGALRVFGGAEVWGVGASGGTGERARLKSEAELRYLARCLGGDYAGGIGFTPVAQDPVLVPAEAVLRVVVG